MDLVYYFCFIVFLRMFGLFDLRGGRLYRGMVYFIESRDVGFEGEVEVVSVGVGGLVLIIKDIFRLLLFLFHFFF